MENTHLCRLTLSCILLWKESLWVLKKGTDTVQENHYLVTNHHAPTKNVPFPSHNHLADARAIIKVKGHPHQWLAGGYDLEIGHFLRWLVW